MNTVRKLFALGAFLTFLVAAGVTSGNAQAYSGRGTGIRSVLTINGNSTTTAVADTCPLSITGGSNIATTPVGFISGLARTGPITSTASGAGTTSQASSTVQDLNLVAGGYTIRATSVSSNAQCNCCVPTAPACGGRSSITGLTVTDPSGAPVAIVPNGSVNQTFTLPTGTIILNEQISSPGQIDVNAIHVNITGANGTNYNVIVAGSHADIDCTVTSPTPGRVTISGRILDANGVGLSKARITISNGSGVVATAMGSSTGNFVLENIESGDTYILQASRMGYSFQPVAINVTEEMTVDVRADPAARASSK